MATLAIQNTSVPKGTNAAGVTPTRASAASAGDKFPNDGNVYLLVETGSGATVVTVNSVNPSNYGFDQDPQVSVAANSAKICGPFAMGRFNSADGFVSLTYSAVANVRVTCFRGMG